MAKSQFPWDLLKAECLRLVCTQLVQASNEGGSYHGASRKDDMVEFLRDVEERGLEPAIKKMEQTQTPRKPASTIAQVSPKRKSSRLREGNEEDEGPNYNTRYKGAKRVKLSKEDNEPVSASRPVTPRKAGRPRKSTQAATEGETTSARKRGPTRQPASTPSTPAKRGRAQSSRRGALEENQGLTSAKRGRGRARKSATAADGDNDDEEEASQEEKSKRGRGRPRKSATGTSTSKAPVSKGKQVFAGVVLQSKKSLLRHALSTKAGDDLDADGEAEPSGVAPADPEDGGDEEIAVPPVAGINGFTTGEAESAPDSSNKENDPNDMVFIGNETDVHADADADAEGDDDVAL